MKYYGNFAIKSYGKGELASAYLPDVTSKSALKAFNKWIEKMPGLQDELKEMGLSSKDRRYTPLQVQAIVDRFGEP